MNDTNIEIRSRQGWRFLPNKKPSYWHLAGCGGILVGVYALVFVMAHRNEMRQTRRLQLAGKKFPTSPNKAEL